RVPTGITTVVPPERSHYLAEVADTVRAYHARTAEQVEVARRRQGLRTTRELLARSGKPTADVEALLDETERQLDAESRALLDDWPATVEAYSRDEHVVTVGSREVRTPLRHESLAGTPVPKVALPRYGDDGDLLRWLRSENLPGRFPFTAGVFPFRTGEDPTRMFAGEGDAVRTNRRFHFLAQDSSATRLSTAFDSV